MSKKQERSIDFINNLQKFLDHFPDGHFILDKSGKFVAFNKQALLILDKENKALIGKHYSKVKLFKLKDDHQIKKQFDSVYKSKSKKVIQYELVPRGDQSIVINLSLVPITFEKEKLILGSIDDVTTRFQLINELRVARDLAEEYLKIAGVLIMGLNKRGNITMINDAGAEALGGSIDQLVGMNWFKNFLRKEDVYRNKQLFQKLLQKGNSTKVIDGYIVDLSGEEKYFKWFNTVVKNEEGIVTGVLSSGHDVTKQVEQIEKLNLYKTGFSSSPNSVMLITYNNSVPQIIEVNPGFTAMYGYTEKEAFGQNPKILQSGETSDELYKDMWSKILNPNIGYWTGQLVNKTKTGEMIHVILTINTVFEDQNSPRYFLAHHVDITEEFKQKQALEKVDELKSRFITSITHVTRTPLTKLRWNLESLLSGDFGGKVTNEEQLIIKHALENTNEINHLIRDMNLAIDVERNALTLVNQKISLPTIVSASVQNVKNRFPSKPLAVKQSLKKVSSIMGDPKYLRIVVESLVENAFRYSEEGKVNISVSETKNSVNLKVTDHGIGIPEAEKDLIFTNFYRASNASTIFPGGVGVQLANAKEIVRLHGGTLTFESVEGEGTTFILKLPKKTQK